MFFTQLCCLLPAIPWALNDLQINQNMKPDSMPLLCTIQSACQTVQPRQKGFKESCLNTWLPVNIRFSTNNALNTAALFKLGGKDYPRRSKTLRKSNSQRKQRMAKWLSAFCSSTSSCKQSDQIKNRSSPCMQHRLSLNSQCRNWYQQLLFYRPLWN